jgi:hypothetical protein
MIYFGKNMVPQQTHELNNMPQLDMDTVPVIPSQVVVFGSQLVDKNSATPYTDATQVSRVKMPGKIGKLKNFVSCFLLLLTDCYLFF